MVEKFANIFRIPDLRRRILFTLGLLAVYRLGGHIPTPGVNADRLQQFFEQNRGTFLGFVDLFSGGQLRRLTIFALGIMPYITASIILQLLTVVYEPLAKLQKEGELGRKKITQWTRYLTVVLSAVQSLGIAISLEKSGDFVVNPGIGFTLMTMLTLTTGSAFIMWLGEQITERGVGNGMSLLIFAGIVVGLPRGVADLIDKVRTDAWGAFTAPAMILLVGLMILVVAFIVYVERSERRIQVQYAKRVVGRKVMGGQSTHLPLRVNAGGVMPVIFASSILTMPQMLFQGLRNNRYFGDLIHALGWGEPLYTLLYAVGIIFFAYFYVSIVFNPNEVADNMRKYGGYPPRQAHGRSHQRNSDSHHAGWRPLSDHHLLYPGVDDRGHSSESPMGAGGSLFRAIAHVGDEWSGRNVLFWRHFPAHCCGSCHGHRHAD
jgi:preprotein translocase subunit SecY